MVWFSDQISWFAKAVIRVPWSLASLVSSSRGAPRNAQDAREALNEEIRRKEPSYLIPSDLRVHVCTWNVANRPPRDCIQQWLVPDASSPPDIVVICLQEVELGGAALMLEVTEASVAWNEAIMEAMNKVESGVRYKKVEIVQLVGIVLIVLARTDVGQITNVKRSVTRTGLSGVMGNKGAVGIRLSLAGKRFLFVGAHFHPHEGKAAQRNRNYHEAISQLKFDLPAHTDDAADVAQAFFSSKENVQGRVHGQGLAARLFAIRPRKKRQAESSLMLENYDYVFFCGDLNYRLRSIKKDAIACAVEKGDFGALLPHDELLQAMCSLEAFQPFEEMIIRFRPTYKYDIGTETFDTSPKKRAPAWTDRVLFRVSHPQNGHHGNTFTAPQLETQCKHNESTSLHQNRLRPVSYTSPTILLSDHMPVTAAFQAAVFRHDHDALQQSLFEANEALELQVDCDEDAHL